MSAKSRPARSKRAYVFPPRPSAASLQKAAAASQRNHARLTRVRHEFIRRPPEDAASTLAKLLRGGRGGPLRLKLYLALIWMAGRAPHDVSYPARAWAELLDLPDPAGRGERRVREALSWLEEHHLVKTEANPGQPRTVFLRREDASGREYTVPGTAKRGDAIQAGDTYVRLDATFWTNGWATSLSGPGLAVLLALLVITQGGTKAKEWRAPSSRAAMFDLSEDTWTRGVRELREQGLLKVTRLSVGARDRDFDPQRMRNAYTLRLERLDEPPTWRDQ